MGEHGGLAAVRTRWAAVGAAVAVVLGAGGIAVSGATNAEITPSETVIAPCRLMDTRASSQVGPRSTPLGSGTTHTVQVTGKNGNCTLPSDVSSVTMNVTMVSPGQGGFITVFPGGAARPNASNLNYTAGQAPTANLVKVALGTGGTASFFASAGPVDLIADIVSFSSRPRLSTSDLAQGRWDKDRARPTKFTGFNGPSGIAYDGTTIWVTVVNSGSVVKLNPAGTADVVNGLVRVGSEPTGIAFDGTSIWVTNRGSNTVSRINPTTNTVTATVPVGGSPRGIAFDGTSIWVANSNSGTVSKIDPTTNAVTTTVTVGLGPSGILADGTSIWVTNGSSGSVSRINPTTNTVTATVPVGDAPTGIAFDGTNVWVANSNSGTLSKIDPSTNAVVNTLNVGTKPTGIAFDGTSIWVANPVRNSITKVDPASNLVTSTFTQDGNPGFLAFDGTNMWVTNFDGGTVVRMRAS